MVGFMLNTLQCVRLDMAHAFLYSKRDFQALANSRAGSPGLEESRVKFMLGKLLI
jgi:hypothetical protein